MKHPCTEIAVFGSRRMKWSIAQIAHRLWGDPNSIDYPSILPDRRPPNWNPGREPANPLPLDEFITRLFSVSGRPGIKQRFTLVLGGEAVRMCPYELARRYTDWAVSHACSEQRKADDVADGIRPAISEAKKLLRSPKLAAHIDRTSKQIGRVLELGAVRSSHNKLLEPNLSGLQATERVAKLLAELTDLLPDAIGEMKELSAAHAQTRAGDVWGVTFASVLGDAWVHMVGELPTATGGFADFLDAAWNSLEDPAPRGRDWDSQMRTAIKNKGLDWRHTPSEKLKGVCP
jgi:hypothetical protein